VSRSSFGDVKKGASCDESFDADSAGTSGTDERSSTSIASFAHTTQLPERPSGEPPASSGDAVMDVASVVAGAGSRARARLQHRPKFLAFLSHHKEDGGDAARIFVDTARRVVGDGGADAGLAELSEDLIFLDSSNLSDLRKLLGHVEEAANYILLLTRCVLERPWVLAELVRAYKIGKHMIVINPSWPGDESSALGRSFRFPQHLDDAIDEWQEYFYEASLRKKAMDAIEGSSERGRFSALRRMLEGSVLFQRLKWALQAQERPANPSTWVGERWDVILGTITALKAHPARTLSRAFNGKFELLVDSPLEEHEV